MSVFQRQSEIDISGLNDKELESTLNLSEFLTRYHAHFNALLPETSDINDHGDDQEKNNADSSQGEPSKNTSSQCDKRVVISPQDLLSAVDYRHDLERYNLLASLIRTVQQPDYQVNDSMDDSMNDSMNDHERGRNSQNLDKLRQEEQTRLCLRMQSRVGEGRMSTDQDVLGIIEALEVKVTKEISTELLLDTISKDTHHAGSTSDGENQSASIPSCSTLLGMPSGNYFASILPECLFDLEKSQHDENNDQSFATLAVPANALTWKELLRLSEMVSKVKDEDRDAIYSSHLTYTHMARLDLRHHVKGSKINLYSKDRLSGDEKMLLSINSELRGTDLVALWIRAQRDTGASRHLLGLFNINEVKDEKATKESDRLRSEVIDVDATDKGIPTEISFVPEPQQSSLEFACGPQYTATFVGNPSKMRNRIEKEALMLDKLTEWAVMNQILFTQEHMRKLVAEHDTMSDANSKKRRAESTLSANDLQKRNRICQDMPENLQVAYQSYILRWFVRRNHSILRIVLTSSPPDDTHFLSFLGAKFNETMKEIKTYLSDKFDSTDRTIARIDRRILMGKFYNNFEFFKETIKQLLEALGSVLSHNKNALDQVNRATEDFDNICNAILSNEQHDYMPLLQPKSSKGNDKLSCEDAEETAFILKSHPKPWPDEKCSLCSKQMSKETRITCSNCGQCEHKLCSSSFSASSPLRSLDDDASKYLTGIYLATKELPQEPDFVQRPINWEKKVITLQRKTIGHGKFPKWGIKMLNSETCSEELNGGLHNFVNPTRWSFIHDSKVPIEGVPMRVPHCGLIVTKSEGPAMISGMKEGDVIVEVQVLNQKSSTIEKKVLKEIKNGDDRKQLMGTPSEKMVCTIYRPSEKIVSIAKQFYYDLLNAYNEAKKMHNDIIEDLWYCDNCQDGNQSSFSVKEEALLCQMVIRRIGMDECFRPFHDENAPPTSSNEDMPTNDKNGEEVISLTSKSSSEHYELNFAHFDHISLRRLDQIMTYLSSPKEDRPCNKCLYTPPWTAKEKLCWATPLLLSNPSQLLCAGLVLIIKRAKNIRFNETKVKPLLKKFMYTFVPWCLDYRSQKSKGPPLDAKVSTVPWLLESCKQCALRGVSNSISTFCGYCTKTRSKVFLDENCHGRKKKSEEETTPVDATLYSEHLSHNAILRYDLHSSYVGTSLLIPIDDPLVRAVCEKTKLVVDEGRRNVELLVISYVSKTLISKDNKEKLVYEDFCGTFDDHWQTPEGLFYILPILSSYQMNYISQFCDQRQPGTLPSNSAMLSLEGIIALAPSQLMTRLQGSVSMHAAVDRAVGSIAAKFGKSKLPTIVTESEADYHGNQTAFSQLQILDYDFMDITHILCNEDLPLAPHLRCLQSDQLLWAIDFCLKVPTEFSLASLLNTAHCCQRIGFIDNANLQTCGKILEKSKGVEDNTGAVQNLRKCLSGIIIFDESEAAKNKECDVCYSDLLYWSPSSTKKKSQLLFYAMNNSNIAVSQISLRRPQDNHKNTQGNECIIVVLHRDFGQDDGDEIMMDSDDDEYSPENDVNGSPAKFCGQGWGMELIRWSGEKSSLRVGRIAPGSPAEASGLEMHDIVIAINGLGLRKMKTNADIACNLLGEIDLKNDLQSDKFPAVPYLFRRTNKEGVKGPIVLSVIRLNDVSQQSHARQRSQRKIAKVKQGQAKPTQVHYPIPQPRPPLPPPPQPLTYHNYVPSIIMPVQPHIISYHNNPEPAHAYPLPAELLPSTPQPCRESITRKHLYNAGVNRTFLSIAEIAVMMHSVSENHPNLSIRLLKPRYPAHRINEEYVHVVKPYVEKYGMEKIPIISDHMWQSILKYDLKRMQHETGPVVFHENGFGYKEPNQIFPIDRFFEQYFTEKRKQDVVARQPSASTIDLTEETSHQFATAPNDDLNTMRIRGGGTDEEVTRHTNGRDMLDNTLQSFNSIVIENYERRWILGKTSKNIVFIGSIKRSGNEYILMYVYSSDRGVLPRVEVGAIDPESKVFLISKISTSDSIDTVVQKGLLQFQNLTKEHNVVIDVNQVDELYFSLLGVLPDGRSLHWFSSDPKGVYICTELGKLASAPPIDSPEILASFEKNAKDAKYSGLKFPVMDFTAAKSSYFCPWGCCAKPGARNAETNSLSILSFESVKKWQDHIHTFHFYSSSRTNIQFSRIGEGTSIQDLCADLTSHICSISIVFHKFINNYEHKDDAKRGVQNNPMMGSIIFDVNSFPRLPNKEINLSILRGEENLRILGRALRVWDRLVYLFNVENDGKLRTRFVPQTFEKFHHETALNDQIEFTNLLDGIGAEGLESSLQIETPKSVMHSSCIRNTWNDGKNLNCHLCNGNNESIIASRNDGPQHSFGCGLTSSLCFARKVNSAAREMLLVAINGMLPITGDLDVLKILVLKIAANMPQSLHASTMPMFADIPVSSFWDNIDKWIGFTRNCLNIRMIAQSVVTLQSSIKKQKLPRWWKSSKTGWSASLLTMQNPTISSIAVLLFTLDIAVSEYMATTKDDLTNRVDVIPTLPINRANIEGEEQKSSSLFLQKLDKMPLKDRYKLLETLATKFGLPPHDDKYAEECMNCGIGGDLLCCEYCENVTHGHCLGFTTNLDEVAFVCKECIIDIAKHIEGEEEEQKSFRLFLQKLDKMPVKDRYKLLETLATKFGLPPHDDEYAEECMNCGIGGDLLCCEYCKNVTHGHCLGFTTNLDEVAFACKECIIDIAKLKDAWDRDEAKRKIASQNK
jgi:hypothetical protein